MRRRPPVLLSTAHWYGTLAAVRELGRRGIEVHVASSGPLRQARWSRYAAVSHDCPDERDTRDYGDWLLELGQCHPGLALCATSDHVAFVHAARKAELAVPFLLDVPDIGVLREVLDKTRLQEHASQAGLQTPRTTFPADAAGAESFAAQMPWPLLIKQRTQAGSITLHKGTPVREPGELRDAYARFTERNTFASEVRSRWPGVERPMLQEYLPQCSRRILCLAGFLSPDGERWAMRAALKVLSHPRYLGIGLLFENTPVLPGLEERVLQMCRTIGYQGMFQCEFLERDGEHLLIDFNPRFYNYMAFDHARGLPQAYLAYLSAIGAQSELRAEIEKARASAPGAEGMIYHDRIGAWTQLRLERLFRRVGREEPAKWRAWRGSARAAIDPVWVGDDPKPALVDVLVRLWHTARHPGDFLRSNAAKAL